MAERTRALAQADAAAFAEVSEKLACLDDFRLAGAGSLARQETDEALSKAAEGKKEVAKVVAESGQIASLVTTLAPLLCFRSFRRTLPLSLALCGYSSTFGGVTQGLAKRTRLGRF